MADAIAAMLGARFDEEKYQGLIAEAAHAGQRILLVKPQTYMNASGECVAGVIRRRIHDLGDLLIVTDDVNLPLGKIRMRPAGSDGGHNGLKSIIERRRQRISTNAHGCGKGKARRLPRGPCSLTIQPGRAADCRGDD